MPKIEVGQKMQDFTFDTPFRSGVKLSEAVDGKITAIVFLRYYGCTLCQYDIHKYAKEYGAIEASGGKLLIALQSDPEKMAEDLGSKDKMPFTFICDPLQKLYGKFSIEAAESKLKMAGPCTLAKIAKAKAAGYQHGRYEGEELQLPAVFVVTPDLKVTYVHYGKTVDDVPDTKALAALLNGEN